MLSTIEREGVNQLVIVGDAFAKPILRALDANPGKWDLSSLFMIASSGVMFSEESKQGLLGHNPAMMIVDAFSLVRGRRHGPVGVHRPVARRRRRSSCWASTAR